MVPVMEEVNEHCKCATYAGTPLLTVLLSWAHDCRTVRPSFTNVNVSAIGSGKCTMYANVSLAHLSYALLLAARSEMAIWAAGWTTRHDVVPTPTPIPL